MPNRSQPIIYRLSDGTRFEPCYRAGYVRCEACLEMILPSAVIGHVCNRWWNISMEEYIYRMMKLFNDARK